MTSQTGRSDEQLRAEARTAASKRLRDVHSRDWNQFLAEEMSTRGIEWRPRLNPTEKAAEEIKRLLAEHPDLRTNEDLFRPDSA
jgi:hypothetical protein